MVHMVWIVPKFVEIVQTTIHAIKNLEYAFKDVISDFIQTNVKVSKL